MKKPTFTCAHCKGTGQAPLSKELLAVLDLTKGKVRVSVDDLAAKLDITPQGVNARLVSLRTMGFLDRERRGKAFVYFRAPMKKAA